MRNSRLAVLLLAVLALVIAGLMVETYWDCRLLKGGSLKECAPGRPGPTGLGSFSDLNSRYLPYRG
jgi:hypothetical protein